MRCSKCGGEYAAIYDTCPTCGIPLEGKLPEPPRAVPTLPVAWAGLFFALPELALVFVLQVTDEANLVDGLVSLFRLIQSGLISYWLWCVYRLHEVLEVISKGQYSISPAAAVGWHFAPIFNLYWVVRWTRTAAQFLRSRAPGLAVPGTTIGLLLLGGLIVRLFVPALSTIIMFAAMQWLVSKVHKAIKIPSALGEKLSTFQPRCENPEVTR